MPADGAEPPYLTSTALNWSGVEVQRARRAPTAGETKEHSYAQPAVFLYHTEKPIHGEVFVAGEKRCGKLAANTVSIAPPDAPIRGNRYGYCEITVIYIDPSTFTEIARAETGCDLPEIRPQYAIEDPLIRSVGMMLDAELFAAQPNSRVYAESLAVALAAQIYAKYSNRKFQGAAPVLNAPQLRRSIEFINDNLHKDLTLAEMAAIANMSKYHFAKSFRQLTGMPPHHYLVKRRIEKARRLLAVESMSLQEIAQSVGYTDKAHFAAQFRKIAGISPRGYRLNI